MLCTLARTSLRVSLELLWYDYGGSAVVSPEPVVTPMILARSHAAVKLSPVASQAHLSCEMMRRSLRPVLMPYNAETVDPALHSQEKQDKRLRRL
jgi:hypothetical protein